MNTNGRRFVFIAAVLTLLPTDVSLSGRQSQNSLVGTWTLVSWESRSSTGEVSYPMGERPKGLLMYDSKGRVSAQLMQPGRPAFESRDRLRGTPEEVKAAFEGFVAYFGRYTLDEKQRTVIHHVEASSFPNDVGTDLRRSFTVAERRLTLRTPQRILGGATGTGTLVWERVD